MTRPFQVGLILILMYAEKNREEDLIRAFFRKCVTAVWVKDKVQHDHRIQS